MAVGNDAGHGGLPDLGPRGSRALATIPGGHAFHLSVAALLCNDFHPYGSPQPRHCADCRFAQRCAGDIEATVLFAASLRPWA
jgi:hypothetical protein